MTDGSLPSYSVVVEMENAQRIDWQEITIMLQTLAEQVRENRPTDGTRPQVILSQAGVPADNDTLLAAVQKHVPTLVEVADFECVNVPNGRYYQLKNAGLQRAKNDLVVLLDADLLPEPGWLAQLLKPFQQSTTLATNGLTYLGHRSFLSRTLALIWIFPLRERDDRAANRRPLNANNCAFRADWLRANPFPIDNGFKVSCTKLTQQLRSNGGDILRVPAYAKHAPLQGWRFLLWRALVTGRDADRKFADMKSTSRSRRLLNALKFWFKSESRVLKRIATKARTVAMPLWEVPGAMFLGCLFYSLALLGQMAAAVGLTRDVPEQIPAYVENH
ncbi:glycosyltransferase [Anatilimnocola floriformis]|uniref:glycosyltransferase n=1 Tax=Anatilimnocola floriformis TaxID=2948575 RepID=UPI0020C1E689|nr:glycosyltransferase [Anatilimnocola floriformis]